MKNNIDFLNFLKETVTMGLDNTEMLLKSLKNKENKIIEEIEDILKNYNKFLCEINNLLNSDENDSKVGILTKTATKMSIKKHVMQDNSDVNIADMLIKALTMAEIEISKEIKDNKESVSNEELTIAKDILKFHENKIECVKKYL